MYQTKYSESKAFAIDIAKHWNELIDKNEQMVVIALGYDKMAEANLEIIANIRRDLGGINIVLRTIEPSNVVYEVIVHEISQDSLFFAIDSLLDYAQSVIDANITTPVTKN